MVVLARVPFIGQIDLFEIIFRITLNYINTLVLKTLILQLNTKCLLV